MARRRSPSGGERPPQGAQALAAKHRLIELVGREPELWPLLNELTLSERIDWPAIERVLHRKLSIDSLGQNALLRVCQGDGAHRKGIEMVPKYSVGQIVALKSGTQHRILAVYECKAERGYRYSTMTVRDGKLYGPFRNITDKTPTTEKGA